MSAGSSGCTCTEAPDPVNADRSRRPDQLPEERAGQLGAHHRDQEQRQSVQQGQPPGLPVSQPERGEPRGEPGPVSPVQGQAEQHRGNAAGRSGRHAQLEQPGRLLHRRCVRGRLQHRGAGGELETGQGPVQRGAERGHVDPGSGEQHRVRRGAAADAGSPPRRAG